MHHFAPLCCANVISTAKAPRGLSVALITSDGIQMLPDVTVIFRSTQTKGISAKRLMTGIYITEGV